ncbi:zinc finger protein 182-like [Zerene cesonia]|uniref:zinc finger protein 182-like n=1 Tax=Zerene cesonia TaxID=33412 RepID=UPI0018E5A2C2|nr:zinc finger protein 182-like [Zerene cesonia]
MNLEYIKPGIKLEYADNIFYSKHITFEEPMKEEINVEDEVFLRATPTSFTAYDDLILEGPRMCSLCDGVFPNSFTFLQHNIDHIEVPLIKLSVHTCKKCNHTFHSRSDLRKHTQTHKSSSLELQRCDICDKNITRKYWSTHIDEVHGMLRLECEVCKKVVKTLKTLKRHMMFIHNKIYKPWRFRRQACETDDEYQCRKCPKIFKHKYSLHTHMKNCHADIQIQCDVCKKTFSSKPYLNTHLQRVHFFDGDEHACDICGKSFKSKRRVCIHKKNSHKNYRA